MTHRIVDPRYMKIQEWADTLCLDLDEYAVIPQLSNPDRWQDWAAGLLAIDVFINQAIPSPYGFDNWQDWAAALVNVMNGGR